MKRLRNPATRAASANYARSVFCSCPSAAPRSATACARTPSSTPFNCGRAATHARSTIVATARHLPNHVSRRANRLARCVRHLATDVLNCGTCGHACGIGQLCSSSLQLSVGAPRSATAWCTDPKSDPLNCGACGHLPARTGMQRQTVFAPRSASRARPRRQHLYELAER